MKIAIRDDDTSFYTKAEELEAAFSDLKDVPISLSIVPFAVADHAGSRPYGDVVSTQRYADIERNEELVSYIKTEMSNGRYEVVQHGIHHELKKTEQGKLLVETEFLSREELKQGIDQGRRHLERVFNTKVNVFAAPCNAVSAKCSQVLDEIGMNTHCIVRWLMIRKLSAPYLRNYLRCSAFRILHGERYGGTMPYPNHKEMNTVEFTSLEDAWRQYQMCKKNGFSMTIFTHYWNLNRDAEKKKALMRFVQKASADGAEFVLVSECF